MKTLVVANQKGGVGKTAIAVHLAYDFIERGYRVAFIDLDTQGNASFTLEAFGSERTARAMFSDDEIGEVVSVYGMALIKADSHVADVQAAPIAVAAASFKARLDEIAEQGFDICIIDTGPALATPLVAALRNATHVLSPVELEAYSGQGIGKMLAMLDNVRTHNPELALVGIVASKVNGRSQRHTETLESLYRAFPTVMVPYTIGQRESIAQSAVERTPVWNDRKSAARKAGAEMRALAKYVIDQINPSKEA